MFKKVHNINNPRKLIPAKKSLNGQIAKINTREMQFFSKKKKPQKLVPAKISTIKVVSRTSYITVFRKYLLYQRSHTKHQVDYYSEAQF